MYKIVLLGFCSVSLCLYTMDEDTWSTGLLTPPLSHEPEHTPPPTGGIDDFDTWNREADVSDELAELITQQVHLRAEVTRLAWSSNTFLGTGITPQEREVDSKSVAQDAEKLRMREAELAEITSRIEEMLSLKTRTESDGI